MAAKIRSMFDRVDNVSASFWKAAQPEGLLMLAEVLEILVIVIYTGIMLRQTLSSDFRKARTSVESIFDVEAPGKLDSKESGDKWSIMINMAYEIITK
ncbi:hypothetical protein MMC32_008087 [Xylographa parallela]|nr:hypothetical protein [Xylographa parallela]